MTRRAMTSAAFMLPLAFAVAAAGAAGTEPGPAAPTTDPGFKVLDTLAELKKISDERHAACLKSFGHEQFCNCLNGRLTLDLTFDDYVALVTHNGGDPVYRALPVEKQKLAGAAAEVRDQCMKKAFH